MSGGVPSTEPLAAMGKPKARAVNGNGTFSRRASNSLPSGEVSGSSTPTTGFQRHALVNKQLDMVMRTPGRQPSPQPTHLGIPGGTHRLLSEEDSGYVAAKFEGKNKQMEAGELTPSFHQRWSFRSLNNG